ncbi:MAG: carboxyl transferase domain-containing protein [Fusobacterium gastrosuis]|uniref:acyl-CoA carboxylase subunit beta n=1 Tax=Fusobacterium gastrosuis TaxID=1755100 RepID=UPI0025FF02B6|nr:carboxyl transferase domain-containing protein [uncultured Fusobacterium sp.]MDD7392054.1 carboxyl transferase domain-containing protein [Fusobacteriaceae bacterium]MDY4010453.1 carboxyl transferase domain-containing protein [Fusobacterium gastrosuis]MDD7410814.1 carboxyl transferase domain-containing protein [Fusobacteriaceae bacterium]MDY5713167.1 carboxyl transferase domain-containing protein [Fusobacterium gastrosuis]MDY5795616.1 carboxyl transferase domain-containing protein [Fusobacte
MSNFSMPKYFQNMPIVGKPISAIDEVNENEIREVEEAIAQEIEAMQQAGTPDEKINEKGQMTALQRVAELIDEGTWYPLNTLYNPEDFETGTGIVKGLARIEGKWAVVVASDNKKIVGAWVPGQAENLLRASDTAKCLGIPLVYVLNCSGVKLDEQEMVYPNRRGGGTPFFRNAELQQLGIPVIVGIYGTNPAGGGYHSISPTILIAHEDANMAVGGAGIVGGMNPKGYIDMEGAIQIAEATMKSKNVEVPGTVDIHYNETGFFREVYGDEIGVLEGIRKYMSYLPAYNLDFFRVDEPAEPQLDPEDLYSIIPMNQKKIYNIYDIIGRLFDNSEFSEYKKGYGPEVVTGLAKVEGLLVGVVANAQGLLMNYPEYKEKSVGIGGKLYRQGLIKMSEFVNLCSRDRIPIVWLQDTTGIDVGNDAEKAELLGLGQSLIYSIENSGVPQIEISIRKASAAAHYVLGGPQGNNTNAFSLGTAATEVYVMNGETAASAMYSRRLAKDHQAGKDLQPTIDKMNKLIEEYKTKSRPAFCAKKGMVDEIVPLRDLRGYISAFANAVYQNPKSICAFHQMILPRAIREFNTFIKK